jgi:hypothetical protein
MVVWFLWWCGREAPFDYVVIQHYPNGQASPHTSIKIYACTQINLIVREALSNNRDI